jgi:predicted ribosome quality control (RQC) complex YloA/Tae2 family protein
VYQERSIPAFCINIFVTGHSLHQNYHFLKRLAPAISKRLVGKVFVEAFSQERDELVIVFADSNEVISDSGQFFIKASLRNDFSCLSFPENFQRARRNSVNLFTMLAGAQVTSVKVFRNERAMGVGLSNGWTLVFKLFGNRSNIVAFNGQGKVEEVFNHKLVTDAALLLTQLDREIDQSYQAFERNEFKYDSLFPTFGKILRAQLDILLASENDGESRWRLIQSFLSRLELEPIRLSRLEGIPVLSLIETGELVQLFSDPIEALNAFVNAWLRLNGVDKEKADILRILKKRIKQTESYLENTFSKLAGLEQGPANDEIANILMANLHAVPARAENVELTDFYRDQPIVIKLKKDLSPQKNAEVYYRKSKNEKIELARLYDGLDAREQDRKRMLGYTEDIQKIEVLKELRAYIKTNGLVAGSPAAASPAELFKKVEYKGYVIYIGRNAKNNDLLTRQFAVKDDLWLHARDVPGSHVVIKYQPGRKYPSEVIERAAELAAFYSKRKTDSLCPVIVTPKKYVRKNKGLADGAVIIDKEDVVMVVPRGE